MDEKQTLTIEFSVEVGVDVEQALNQILLIPIPRHHTPLRSHDDDMAYRLEVDIVTLVRNEIATHLRSLPYIFLNDTRHVRTRAYRGPLPREAD